MASSIRISLGDLAHEAGVHTSTVSRALRNDRQVSIATRLRIQNLARERGYVPDPMLSALVVYRKQKSVVQYQGTLAWLNTNPQPERLYRSNQFSTYHAGARERCAELGYQLEEFRLADFQMDTGRLTKVLRARNIQGLLLPPQSRARSHLHFEWELFSCISFGFSLARPQFHVVTNAQFQSCRLAIRKLRSLGYRRIGLITSVESVERTDQNFMAAFLVEQRRFLPSERLPMLIFHKKGKMQTWGKTSKKDFERWFARHRPEAILSCSSGVVPDKERKKCGVAYLNLDESPGEYSGIYQNDRLIGRTAVDALISMIHANERGIPADPRIILVKGRWIDGPSAPRITGQNRRVKVKRLSARRVR